MTRTIRTLALTLSLIIPCAAPGSAAAITCAECGMMVDMGSKFSSRIVQGGNISYFCDIGDLLINLSKKSLTKGTAQVKDYKSGEWIDARSAFYVHAEKKFRTPMGWGIASFRDKNDAAGFGTVMDFDSMANALK